jgi:flavorubredoxin
MSRVLILYDTRTGNTEQMARAVAEGTKSVEGVEVVLKRVAEGGGELAGADGVILGSPTHRTQPSQATKRLLSDLSNVPLKGKVGGAFGSYGWSGEAPAIMARALRDQGVRVIGETLRVRKTPGASDLTRCKDLGRAVAEGIAPVGGQEKGG